MQRHLQKCKAPKQSKVTNTLTLKSAKCKDILKSARHAKQSKLYIDCIDYHRLCKVHEHVN